MKIYMFPGQGSQAKGMGGELFDRFGDITEQADSILGYSIKELCLEDPRGELGKTQFTQPALYTVNALSYFAKLDDGGGNPDFFIGHSLGEFDALMAAGCFDFKTGLKFVQKRGALMGEVSGGGMAAVLNSTKDKIEETLAEGGIDDVYLANYNSPSQIVISGPEAQIAKAQPLFKKRKMRFHPLSTSGAFHSRFMHDAMLQFGEYLQSFKLAAPKIPVVANVTARPYETAKLLETLSSQIASAVQWSESVQYLLASARRRGEGAEFEELGHGDVLTRLVETIRRQTPDDILDGLVPAQDAISVEARNDAPLAARGNQSFERVRSWNEKHAIGTKVRSATMDDAELETRTEAVLLFGHRAAVYMKGYNGYFDLEEVMPA